jgi:biopolymer transport protein ExbD
MAFSTQDSDEVLSEINVTPLVDVMLVLLVVFIVTAPLLTNAIPSTCPRPRPWPRWSRRTRWW